MPSTVTFLNSLQVLASKGIRYGAAIDVGCADGHFSLNLLNMGLAPGAVPVNVDPNPVYEASLKAIQETVGGHYRICAASDRVGEVELTLSTHPYWASLRPADDLYWQRINNLSGEKTTVPTLTLDRLRDELALEPPFLLKLDVQGAEAAVLRGSTALLDDTHVVIVESDIADFQSINGLLIERGFALFDLTGISRTPDGALGWFYPVYINRKIDSVRPKAFWSPEQNDTTIRMQIERRNAILKSNEEILRRLKGPPLAAPAPPVSRNQLCPCGSGRRYKHCCGAYRQA